MPIPPRPTAHYLLAIGIDERPIAAFLAAFNACFTKGGLSSKIDGDHATAPRSKKPVQGNI